ncbi:hypothetical protein Lfu02_35870 [Longispora fulva]|nr:hypothetical protein Lfu02_35870 [Longispora fulva]
MVEEGHRAAQVADRLRLGGEVRVDAPGPERIGAVEEHAASLATGIGRGIREKPVDVRAVGSSRARRRVCGQG